MEIKFGEIKVSFPYEKYVLKHSMENPFGSMLFKPNQEFFNAFFKKASMNYYDEYRSWMEKLLNTGKPGKSEG